MEDVADSAIVDPTDAIIEVTSTAICGSDLHLYGPLSAAMEEGDILGHEAMESVRRGGTVSIIGVHGGPVQMFPMGDLFDMQLQRRMGQANVLRWIPEIHPLIDGDDPLGVDDLVTHRLPLEKAADACEMFRDKSDGYIKVVLDPAA